MWQVSWFSAGRHPVELAEVYVSDTTRPGHRGVDGLSGRVVDGARAIPAPSDAASTRWYVWIPMCSCSSPRSSPGAGEDQRPCVCLPPRPARAAWLLDLAGAVQPRPDRALGTARRIRFLGYLLVRMLLLAFRRGRPAAPLRLTVPVSWLAVAVVFLVGFRIGLNVVNSNVIDVGYAGVIGADKLLHGHKLYGHWPKDNAPGRHLRAGQLLRLRALPGHLRLERDLGQPSRRSRRRDRLRSPDAARAVPARPADPRAHLGVVLAYAWAAYPFSLWALSSNTNDSWSRLLVVATLLVIGSAPARGAGSRSGRADQVRASGPGAAVPARPGLRSWPPRRGVASPSSSPSPPRGRAGHAACPPGRQLLSAFWHDTIVYQAQRRRHSRSGVCGAASGFEQHLVEGAAIALALIVAVVPRERGLVEIAALAAAVLIALQMAGSYWLYSYIVWFFPGRVGRGLRHLSRARRRAGYGAGSRTCSMALARIGSLALITTALSHGSSEEVSKRIGIRVAIASTASSRLTPMTPPRGPVIPTSVM